MNELAALRARLERIEAALREAEHVLGFPKVTKPSGWTYEPVYIKALLEKIRAAFAALGAVDERRKRVGEWILDADEVRTARSQVANPHVYGHVSDERVLALCDTVDALRARAEKAEAALQELIVDLREGEGVGGVMAITVALEDACAMLKGIDSADPALGGADEEERTMNLRIQGGSALYEMIVCLETRDGVHVRNVKIPAFKMLPEVLIWGDRLFTPARPDKPPIYREVFGYVVLDGGEADERSVTGCLSEPTKIQS